MRLKGKIVSLASIKLTDTAFVVILASNKFKGSKAIPYYLMGTV